MTPNFSLLPGNAETAPVWLPALIALTSAAAARSRLDVVELGAAASRLTFVWTGRRRRRCRQT